MDRDFNNFFYDDCDKMQSNTIENMEFSNNSINLDELEENLELEEFQAYKKEVQNA